MTTNEPRQTDPASDSSESSASPNGAPDGAPEFTTDDASLLLPRTGRKPKVRAPKPPGVRINPDLEGMQRFQGSHVGDRHVRVIRQTREEELKRVRPGYLVAGEEASTSRGRVGRAYGRAKRLLIGSPLTTSSAIHERLTKVKALAVLSSDALSSVAYATSPDSPRCR